LTGVTVVQLESRSYSLPLGLSDSSGPSYIQGQYVEINLYREEYVVDRRKKIFLSHKTADKPTVVRFYSVLKALGFDPWLDKEDMPAGTETHRGIREGFDHSCAAVFFLTPKFKDERFLRSEINYAKDEKVKKGERFAIVTLVLAKDKDQVKVPDLLTEYIYASPRTHLEALQEIIRALPIEVGETRWKPHLDAPSKP
jgi:hypothetical protein